MRKLNETKLKEKDDTGVMYVVTSAFCDIEEDDYENGEIGRGTTRDMRDMKGIRFSSLEELYKESDLRYSIEKFDRGSFSADIEDGRIDTGWMENEDGEPPSDREIEQWQNGQVKMYSVHCSIYVERIEVSIPTSRELSKDLGI